MIESARIEVPDNPVYWRVYLTTQGYVPVCMQWFDEFDYDHTCFLSDVHFETRGDALRVAATENMRIASGR